ncbi:MAG: cation:proton antiporter [Acidimicrobiia bacterium]|nr:cation:proton antiporter [Acidimicrobiia bacterium]
MDAIDVAIVALFAVGYGALSKVVERTPLTGPMLFVGFGIAVGSPGFDVLDVPLTDSGVELLAELTLGLLLFSDAIRVDLSRLRVDFALPLRMLAIGLPLAIGIGTILALVVLDVTPALAALTAAILAPTDAALGQTVVTSKQVPMRIRQSLNVESGLNDGIALPAVTVFIAIVVLDEEFSGAASWIRFAAEQIGYGVTVGLAVGFTGGVVVRWCSDRDWMDATFRQIAVLGVALAAFTLALAVGGNGFIATFVAGLAFGTAARETCRHVEDFTEDTAQLLAMVAFIVFGAIVVGPALSELDWRVALYATGSLVVVRPLAIALSLVGAGLRTPTVLFFGWFGPRGLASILFALAALAEATEAELDPMFVVVSWTVLASIVAHGVTATPGAAAYGRWWAAMDDKHDMAEAVPMAEQRIRGGREET